MTRDDQAAQDLPTGTPATEDALAHPPLTVNAVAHVDKPSAGYARGSMRPMAREGVYGLLELAIGQVWGLGRTTILPELYGPDVVDHHPVTPQVAGIAGPTLAVEMFHTALSDLTMQLPGVLVDGDRGVDWWTRRGAYLGPLGPLAPTGRTVEFFGSDAARVAGGRIVEMWQVDDMLATAPQLTGREPAAAVRAMV